MSVQRRPNTFSEEMDDLVREFRPANDEFDLNNTQILNESNIVENYLDQQ